MKIEVSAKTIEKAIEEGLKQLNTTLESYFGRWTFQKSKNWNGI